MQRKSDESRATTLRQRFAFTSRPWTNTIGGPEPASKASTVPCGTSTLRASPSAGSRQAARSAELTGPS